MLCPRCQSDTMVIMTRSYDETVIRVRRCRRCKIRFETEETCNGNMKASTEGRATK